MEPKKHSDEESETSNSDEESETSNFDEESEIPEIIHFNTMNGVWNLFETLKIWIHDREHPYGLIDPDFMKIWKKLFNSIWNSDEPSIQKELIKMTLALVRKFDNTSGDQISWTTAALKTFETEWDKIEKSRLDELKVLLRQFLGQMFESYDSNSWECGDYYSDIIENLLLDSNISQDFFSYLIEIYMTEFTKETYTAIPCYIVERFFQPFANYLVTKEDDQQIQHIIKYIFRYSILRSSVVLNYKQKLSTSKQVEHRDESINVMQHSEEDNKSCENLMELNCCPKTIADMLQACMSYPGATEKGCQEITKLIREFSDLAEGKMPLSLQNTNNID